MAIQSEHSHCRVTWSEISFSAVLTGMQLRCFDHESVPSALGRSWSFSPDRAERSSAQRSIRATCTSPAQNLLGAPGAPCPGRLGVVLLRHQLLPQADQERADVGRRREGGYEKSREVASVRRPV